MRPFIEELHHPHQHLEAWQYVLDKVERYPDELNVQPYRKPKDTERAKGLIALTLSRSGQLTKDGGPLVLTIAGADESDTHLLARNAAGFGELCRLLLSERRRGYLQIFASGTAAEFATLLDVYGRHFLAAGYTIHVLGSFLRIVALRITKGRHTWWLCDAEQVSGVPYQALIRQISLLDPIAGQSDTYAAGLYRVLMELQRELVKRFGVSLHPTIGQSAARAASDFIPKEIWLWRPTPLYVAMCRAGGAFRGGYVNAVDYSGPAWKMDVRRQYTAALRGDFPYAVSFGPWSETSMTSRGLFMCTIHGPGKLRILINKWNPNRKTFELTKWNGKECVAILPTVEIEGLTALGYLVLPGYGFVHNHTFNFAGFVNRLNRLTQIHGADSLIGQMCKSLGSKVWGKWAQAPQRTELAYAAGRPGRDWSPMTKDSGDEIENLWTRQRVTYNSMQHIELATQVTAIGRRQVYVKAAQLLKAGFKLAEILTDCIIVQGPAPPRPPMLEVNIGQWRYEGWSGTVHTRRTGAYVWQDEPHRPGKAGATTAEIINLGHKEAPPEGEASELVSRLRWMR